MTYLYEKAVVPADGLRLHLNENTSGCSPAVMAALRTMTPEMVAFYPDYSAPLAAAARHFGVDESHVLLTNGLDEGILAACLAAVVPDPLSPAPAQSAEAIVVVPAFEMQAACARTAGARIIEVPLETNFAFPAQKVLEAVRPATRIVFITTPNNPTGLLVAADRIFAIASAAPHALIFVDEAYADFSGTTLIGDPRLTAHPNVVIGRTFSKAHGLAALRCGALIGSTKMLRRVEEVLPPYSINVAGAVALTAALDDRRYYESYLDEVRQSKSLLYQMFDRLGIEYWPSEANFVLARFGRDASYVCTQLQERGIHVRDRSSSPQCDGCVRITAGVVAHTRRCIAAIEEVLCEAR